MSEPRTLSNKELKEQIEKLKAQLAEVRHVNCFNEKIEQDKG